jgi:hypothetical protein
MTEFRRRIRAITCAWLLCQAASLAAFVPGECCMSHAAEAAAKSGDAECHESASTSAEASADKVTAPQEGDACPMHHGNSEQAPGTRSHDGCIISNACGGPGQQLTTLFAFIGLLELPPSSPIDPDSIAAGIPQPPPLLHQLSRPDAPPPKVNFA